MVWKFLFFALMIIIFWDELSRYFEAVQRSTGNNVDEIVSIPIIRLFHVWETIFMNWFVTNLITGIWFTITLVNRNINAFRDALTLILFTVNHIPREVTLEIIIVIVEFFIGTFYMVEDLGLKLLMLLRFLRRSIVGFILIAAKYLLHSFRSLVNAVWKSVVSLKNFLQQLCLKTLHIVWMILTTPVKIVWKAVVLLKNFISQLCIKSLQIIRLILSTLVNIVWKSVVSLKNFLQKLCLKTLHIIWIILTSPVFLVLDFSVFAMSTLLQLFLAFLGFIGFGLKHLIIDFAVAVLVINDLVYPWILYLLMIGINICQFFVTLGLLIFLALKTIVLQIALVILLGVVNIFEFFFHTKDKELERRMEESKERYSQTILAKSQMRLRESQRRLGLASTSDESRPETSDADDASEVVEIFRRKSSRTIRVPVQVQSEEADAELADSESSERFAVDMNDSDAVLRAAERKASAIVRRAELRASRILIDAERKASVIRGDSDQKESDTS